MVTNPPVRLDNLRNFLLRGFGASDLRHLCQEEPDFQHVLYELADDAGPGQIVDKLIEYAERMEQLDKLLALAKAKNPTRYEKHGPYYEGNPDLQKQVSDLAQRLALLSSADSFSQEDQYKIAFWWRELGSKDSLRGFDLCGKNLSGVDLCEADLSSANLHETNLSWAKLHSAKLRAADLGGASLSGTEFNGADLCGAEMSGADLKEATLIRANLRGADLTGADLSGADLRRASLHKTKLDNNTQIDRKWRLVWSIINELVGDYDLPEADLSGADLSGANLRGAKLTEADLSEADLSGANLRGADLRLADLGGAELVGANLRDADLTGAEVTDQQLAQARSLKDATLPDGKKR